MPQETTSEGEKRPLRIGKYEVTAHIATGGMGAVYKAVDTELNRVVALKILAPELAAKPAMVERFKREGRNAARLRHENIVSIYDSGEVSGTHFLALEYVDGRDLHDHVGRRGKLGPTEAREILVQAARALDYAHRQSVVHRDIKPANFLITRHEGGQLLVKLTDLGLARRLDDDECRVTKPETTIGTVDYMSPEQANSSASADIRSDIYSLGCTFYHMLGGRPPFPKGSLVERVMKHREEEPTDILALNPLVPPGLVRILRTMMAKNVEDRYQTPQELLRAVEDPACLQMNNELELRLLGYDPALRPLEGEPGLFPLDEPRLLPLDEPKLRPLEPAGETTTLKLRPEAPPRSKPPTPAPTQPQPPPTEEHPSSAKTEVTARRDKTVVGKKQRYRDPTQELPRSKRKQTPSLPSWWPWAAAGAAVVVIVIVLWTVGRRGPNDDGQAKIDPPPVDAGPDDGDKKPPPKKDPVGTLMGPEEPALPRLFQPALPLDRAKLREEFLGPFLKASAPPSGAALARVRRFPGPEEFRSVAEALAKTAGPLIVEIHDQGPFFEASVPEVRGRWVRIRPGEGYRPLLAWDLADKDKAQPPFLAFTGGSLSLEDIDVVVRWPAVRAEEPGCLFALRGASFEARNCTFSVAGKQSSGFAVVRMEGLARNGAAAALEGGAMDPGLDKTGPARLRLTRCFARGPELMALDAAETSVEALIEGSLLVGGDHPMIRLTGREEDSAALRVVRSTVVCGQNFVTWKGAGGKSGSPHIRCLAWDALIARGDANAPQGDMLYLGDDADLVNVSWRPVNCLYAGWKRLLVSADKSIGAGSLDTWRAIWAVREGDQELSQTWPKQLAPQLETLAAQEFTPYDTAALYAATGGSGPLGCELARLPPEPRLWLQRTYDRYAMPPVPLPDFDTPPEIPAPADGKYHGEVLDLTRVDLGRVLDVRLQLAKPGPRVVLHLVGKGKRFTSPIKVKNVPTLILYFKPPAGNDEPLTLLPHPASVQRDGALIEVENGHLGLIHARLTLDSKAPALAVPAHLVRIRGGQLILHHCQLRGLVDKAPPHYKGLIHVDEADYDEYRLLFRDSVLLSSGSLLDLRGGAHLRVRNCAAVAVDDGFVFTPSASRVFAQIENNTLAFRKALFTVRHEDETPAHPEGTVIQAQHNYFLTPFAGDRHDARMLRAPERTVTAGGLLWQGKENAFDQLRLHGYYAGAKDELSKQSFKDWQQLWGAPGEQDYTLLDAVKMPKAFAVDPPSWTHLALPPQVRVGAGSPPFGADLVRLKLLKGKG
jgi:serine/threonine protein kinase